MNTKLPLTLLVMLSGFSLTAQVVKDTVSKPIDSVALQQIELQKVAKEKTLTPAEAAAIKKAAEQKQKEAEKIKAAAEKRS